MRIGVYIFSVCPYPCQRKHNPESCIYRQFPETVFSIFLDKVSVIVFYSYTTVKYFLKRSINLLFLSDVLIGI